MPERPSVNISETARPKIENQELENLLNNVLNSLRELVYLKQEIRQETEERGKEEYKEKIERIIDLIFNYLTQILSNLDGWEKSKLEKAKEIVRFSLFAHLDFESTWDNPSFHNEIHILAVICAFLEILTPLKGNDIFEIEDTLNQWNEKNKTKITLVEFAIAMVVALATHDLGNILVEIKEEEEGNLRPTFHQFYKAANAEERSQAIASTLITHFNPTRDNNRIVLVTHLIEQTKFQPQPGVEKKDEPWWLLVQIIDQIGGNVVLLSTNPNYYVSAVAGLIIEIAKANNNTIQINLTNFLNFVASRLQTFVANNIIDSDSANQVLVLLSGGQFNSLQDPGINQVNQTNFQEIVAILTQVFPETSISLVIDQENGQTNLVIG